MKLIALLLLVAASYGASAQCSAPTGLSTSNITATAAIANWAPVSGATSYDVDYKPSTSSYWITIAYGTTTLSWGLTGIDVSTSYDWRVRANCATGSSDYTQTQFTTGAIGSCTPPGGLFTTNITTNTVTMNWSPVNGAAFYNVQYKPISSSSWINATTATYATFVNLYSLSANTTYEWRVRTNCSLSESSVYSTAQFSTSGSNPPPTSPTCPGPSDISTNGTMSGAASINNNTDIKGTIAPKYDIDHYKFTITIGGSITVWLTTLPGNYDLVLYNSSGAQIGISKNKGTKNETISLFVAAGDYYAKVYPTGNANSATSCYTLKVYTGTAGRVTTTAANVTAADAKEIVNPNFTINLFPNPAGDQLNVLMEGIQNKTNIKVYNLMGTLVMQQESVNMLTQLNISKLSAGFYIVHVNDGIETRSAKFVKQ